MTSDESCLEVERALGAHGVPVSSLRGDEGGDSAMEGGASQPMAQLSEALAQVLRTHGPPPQAAPGGSHGRADGPSEVCSIQRMPLPKGRDAAFVADEYMRWLPTLLPWLVAVQIDGADVHTLHMKGTRLPFLRLHRSAECSTPDRQLFYIKGGVLSRKDGRGRLEFRDTPDGHSVLAAIHGFRPTLPWPIYRATQAQIHLWVMARFAAHLKRM